MMRRCVRGWTAAPGRGGRLADEQQSRGIAGEVGRGAMDAGRNGAAGIFNGDAPKRADAEGKRLRRRKGVVVQVVALLVEVGAEVGVVASAEFGEESGAGGGKVDTANGVFVAQGFGRGAEVGAEPGVGFDRGAVDVPRVDVERHRAGSVVARIRGETLEDRREAEGAEACLVGEESAGGGAAGGTQREGGEAGGVKRDDSVDEPEAGNDFGEIAGQRARPAEGVYAVGEASGCELVEAVDEFYPWIVGRERERHGRMRRPRDAMVESGRGRTENGSDSEEENERCRAR